MCEHTYYVRNVRTYVRVHYVCIEKAREGRESSNSSSRRRTTSTRNIRSAALPVQEHPRKLLERNAPPNNASTHKTEKQKHGDNTHSTVQCSHTQTQHITQCAQIHTSIKRRRGEGRGKEAENDVPEATTGVDCQLYSEPSAQNEFRSPVLAAVPPPPHTHTHATSTYVSVRDP